MNPWAIVHLGTPVGGTGGISSVLRQYRDGDLAQAWPLRFEASWCDPADGSRLWAATTCAARLWREALAGRVQAVHAHAAAHGSFWRKVALLRPLKALGVRTVLHLHDGRWPAWVQGLPPASRRTVAAALCRADRVAVLAPCFAEAVREVAPAVQPVVLPNPAWPQPGWLNPVPSRDAVIFLGTLSADKGLPTLLQAWSRMLRSASIPPPLRLICAGEGSGEAVQRWVAEAGLTAAQAEGRLQFPGWVDEAQRQALLARARMLVLPSRAEGVPMAALEAMGAEVPVVASAVGGLPELLRGGAGVLVPTLAGQGPSAAALVDAMQQLLADPARARWTAWLGRQRVLRVHAAPRALARVSTLYAGLGLQPRDAVSGLTAILDFPVAAEGGR